MIESARQFVELRTSSRPEEYLRAATESASLEVWMEIIQMFPEMKQWVAHNKSVPIAVLRHLASDADPTVRHFVAMKNKLPPDLMSLLAEDVDDSVRVRIACNKNVDLNTLEKLAKDCSELVSSSARERLQCRRERKTLRASTPPAGQKE